MDASQSALDSLRTVEFRETLKGYHRDDVDEYLEKAAVEAEGLQEQLRQGSERLRQAAERISQLEEMLENQPEPQLPPPPPEPPVADETLQRTLLLAQKFVDQTKSDSEAEAMRLVGDAEARARAITQDAQAKADQIVTQSEGRVREELARLEDKRTRLTNEVELMSRHLENERSRLRQALTDILKWVDANVHPDAAEGDGRTRGSDPSAPPAGPTPSSPSLGEAPASGPERANVLGSSTASTTSPPAAPAGSGGETRDGENGAPSNDRPGSAVRSPGNSAVLPI